VFSVDAAYLVTASSDSTVGPMPRAAHRMRVVCTLAPHTYLDPTPCTLRPVPCTICHVPSVL